MNLNKNNQNVLVIEDLLVREVPVKSHTLAKSIESIFAETKVESSAQPSIELQPVFTVERHQQNDNVSNQKF